jgi:hypothetical protein
MRGLVTPCCTRIYAPLGRALVAWFPYLSGSPALPPVLATNKLICSVALVQYRSGGPIIGEVAAEVERTCAQVKSIHANHSSTRRGDPATVLSSLLWRQPARQGPGRPASGMDRSVSS